MPRFFIFAFVLLIGAEAAAADLNPQRAVTTAEQALARTVFQGLVVRDAEGRIAPGLAESWTISADGLTYRFILRDRLRWVDGPRLTADTVVQSLTRALAPATAAPFYNLLLPIKNAEAFHNGTLVPSAGLGISAPDAKTVQFDLHAPSHSFLAALAAPVAMPARGSVDVAIPEGAFHPQPHADGARVLYQLIVNLAHKPLDQREVRHALGMSIDRDAIIARLQLPQSAPAYGVTETALSARAPYAKLSLPDRNAVAQALLMDTKRDAAAPLRIVVPQQAMHVLVAEAVAAAWRPLGFAVDVVPVPAAAYEKTILNGDFDVAWQPAWGLESTNDARPEQAVSEQAVFLFSQAAGPWNAGHYNEPDLDQFLANADADMNAEYRSSQWRAAEGLLAEDQPAWPLFFYSAMIPSTHDVMGTALKPAIISQP